MTRMVNQDQLTSEHRIRLLEDAGQPRFKLLDHCAPEQRRDRGVTMDLERYCRKRPMTSQSLKDVFELSDSRPS
jgi:hypothetical protein